MEIKRKSFTVNIDVYDIIPVLEIEYTCNASYYSNHEVIELTFEEVEKLYNEMIKLKK